MSTSIRNLTVLIAFALLGAAPPTNSERTARKRAAALATALQKKDYAAALTDAGPELKKALDREALASLWGKVLKQIGELEKVDAPRVVRKGTTVVVLVACRFEKVSLDLHIPFDREVRIAGFALVPGKDTYTYPTPPYAKTDTFTESESTIGEGGKWPLPATLTVPKGKGPFPLVVLVHGSGPHDRDETLGPNKPFRDLAWGLATQGIAVLRHIKRTHRHGAKMIAEKGDLTVNEETIDDALLAVELARKQKRIDPARVFVLGHSLGGFVAPRIGAADPKIAGLIVLAGNTRPLEDLVEEQYAYLLAPDGKWTDETRKRYDDINTKVARIRKGDIPVDAPAQDLLLGLSAAYWRDLKKYDPSATAAKSKQPMLVLQGERDYQVTMADFAGWKKALKGHKDATLKSYATLHHLFMEGKGKGKGSPDEYNLEGHVAQAVIDDIAAWVKKR